MREIKTDRLLLRRFRSGDSEGLYRCLSDPETVKYEPYDPFTREEAAREAARRAGDECFWAVCLQDGTYVGNLYFAKGEFGAWELGYVFCRDCWGRGYAAESARALLDYGFEALGVRRVIAMCNPENESSWRLLERLGLRREGHLRKNIFFFRDADGNPLWQDTYEYGLLKEEWAKAE